MPVHSDGASPFAFTTKRIILFGGFFLLLLGGLYWFYQTPLPISSAPKPGYNDDLRAIAAQTGLPVDEKEALLPHTKTRQSKSKTEPSATLTNAERLRFERTSASSMPKNAQSTDRSTEAATTPAEKPAANVTSATSAVNGEAAPVSRLASVGTKPTSRSTAAPSSNLAETSLTDKPTVQSTPTSVTASPPASKRKTKDGEDVKVDTYKGGFKK